MTVSELLLRLSRSELIEWMAFYQLEPWGARVADNHFGTVAAAIANSSLTRWRFGVNDFFPPRTEQERQKAVEQQVRSVFSRL